jgi:hypothetical protein
VISTREKIAKIMSELKLSDYGARDAKRFEYLIPSEKKREVLERSAKIVYGEAPLMGMAGAALGGDEKHYSRKNIRETAKKVRTYKKGECHSFAQLAVEQLLSKMELKEIPFDTVKIVSHTDPDDFSSSHTYVLLGYKGEDYTPEKLVDTMGTFLIVDLWAVAMGHDTTQGIFTLVEYPYKSMLDNLECVYDSSKDKPLALIPPRPASAPPVLTHRHSFFESKTSNLVSQEGVRILCDRLKHNAVLLNALVDKMTDNKVEATFITLAKKYTHPEKLSKLMESIFKEGYTEKVEKRLLKKGFSADNLSIIKEGAQVLNEGYRKATTQPPLRASVSGKGRS